MKFFSRFSSDGSKLSREATHQSTSMKLPDISIQGDIDQEMLNKALDDIAWMENTYFALEEKLKIRVLEDSGSTASAEEVKPETQKPPHPPEPASKEEQSNSREDKSKKHSRELEQRFKSSSQIFLREEGHEVTGIYMGSGSRYIKKAGRKCFVVYLKVDGEDCFLSGTQLQEEVTAKRLCAGDLISIVKTGQFRKATERSHAKAASFSITVVESSPSVAEDEA